MEMLRRPDRDGVIVGPPSRASPLPQWDWVCSVGDWSNVRPPSLAGQLPPLDWVPAGGNWSAVRPPSLASQLPHWDWVQAVGDWSAFRPPSRAGSLLQKSKSRPPALHHSNGRVSARRKLLILTHRPVGRLSGGIDPGVGAKRPFDEVEHIERRCSEANRRRCARIDPGAKEPRALASGPNVRAQTFGSFGAFAKGTRCKSETASGNTRSNGYTPKTPRTWSAQRPPRSNNIYTNVNRIMPPKLQITINQPLMLIIIDPSNP